MILWPQEDELTERAREALLTFTTTAASAELASSVHAWRCISFPWTDDPPLRLVFEDDTRRQVGFTQAEDGTWLFEELPIDVHERTNEAEDVEAAAIIPPHPSP